jgi:AcrR family transcriptional regulator
MVTPIGLRERKKEKTRESLVAVALGFFDKRGFDHVTVEEIAAACDVSPRTFFRYFAAKEDVLFAEADAQRDRLLGALSTQPKNVSPLRALQAAVLAIATDYEEHRDAVLLRYRIVMSTPSLESRMLERQHSWQRAVIEQLRSSGRARGAKDLDLRLTVAAATTALQVATDYWLDDECRSNLGDLLTTVIDRLATGLDP